MSLYDFRAALKLAADDPPFYALIMAAMLKADTDNAFRLRYAFPDTWRELELRSHCPNGVLEDDMKPVVDDAVDHGETVNPQPPE